MNLVKVYKIQSQSTELSLDVLNSALSWVVPRLKVLSSTKNNWIEQTFVKMEFRH